MILVAETPRDDLRTRTAALLATSSLAASFLGQEAFQDPQPAPFAIVALIAFVVAISTCVFILHPKKDLVFAPQGIAFYKTLYPTSEMGEIYRQMAYELGRHWVSNNLGIEGLTNAFTLAAGAFLLQALSLVALLSDTILL